MPKLKRGSNIPFGLIMPRVVSILELHVFGENFESSNFFLQKQKLLDN